MECVKSSSSSGVSEVEGKSPSETLTPFMLAKIERNRQRALMLRQARLANRPSAGEGVCVCFKNKYNPRYFKNYDTGKFRLIII